MKNLLKRIGLIIIFAAVVSLLFIHVLDNRIGHIYSENEIELSDDMNSSTDSEKTVEENTEEKLDVSEYIKSEFTKNTGGCVITDAVFDDNSFLSLATPYDSSIFPKNAKYTVSVTDADGNSVNEEYFTLWPRMGYISLNDGNSRKILTHTGSEIPIKDISGIYFAGVRNIFGEPLFMDYSKGIYCTIAHDGTIEESWYDPDTDSRGLSFDYPSYFGVTDDWQYQINKTRRGYGYTIEADIRDVQDVNPIYKKAFNYSEGFGCAYDQLGRLYFFNNQGRLRIGGLGEVMYGCGERTDERSLGYYYFDDGLTRITKKQFSKGELISERELLIDRDGDEFSLPGGYSIYSYSNGIILLQKNGLSGYMTSRGKWITDPVFSYARPFFEGLAVVGEKNGKKGVIDKTGKYVVEPYFDEITDCSGGVIALYDKGTGWYILNKMTQYVSEAQ